VLRIVAVADDFNALSMTRPYKASWPIARVLATPQENAGKQFAPPHMVEHFIAILPKILEQTVLRCPRRRRASGGAGAPGRFTLTATVRHRL